MSFEFDVCLMSFTFQSLEFGLSWSLRFSMFRVHVWLCIRGCACACLHVHECTCTHACAYVHVHAREHMWVCACICAHVGVCACMCMSCVHACTHPPDHTHPFISHLHAAVDGCTWLRLGACHSVMHTHGVSGRDGRRVRRCPPSPSCPIPPPHPPT